MTGTWINAAAILLGAFIAIISRKDLNQVVEQRIKIVLAVFAMYVGVTLVWESTHGGFLSHLKQLTLLLLALIVGNGLGMLFGIQKSLNRLAIFAKEQLSHPSRTQGFKLTSALICLTPFAVIGSTLEGLTGDFRVFVLKAAMDGIAAHSFYRLFGKPVILSVIPLLAFQGNLTLVLQWIASSSNHPNVIQGIMGICGLLVFSSVVLIMNAGKPRLADYLPSLMVVIPLAHWFW